MSWGDRVYSRIDRTLVNEEWVLQYPRSFVHYLPEGRFDRCPALVYMSDQLVTCRKQLKFCDMWGAHPAL